MRDRPGEKTAQGHIGVGVLGSCALGAAIVITSVGDHSDLGSPEYWAWILTGLQVVALRAAATGRNWGWLLGASIQLPWIAYALVTGQIGFIPGCLVSAAVQAHGYTRHREASFNRPEPTYA